ncbi:MAG TPA: universal stress protein [Thermomicrobiaceae bacterium]|nr:universal stress protein [Thermomicrobiaceae bacterium]
MTPSIRRMLVPLDGSRLAEAVLPVALAIAAPCGATVTLIHVIEHNAPDTVHGEPHLDDVEEAAGYLEAIAKRFEDSGVTIETHVHPNPEHDVAKSVAEHAAELDSDLIVLATHGSGGLRRLLFGRIAQQVLRQTTTPILLMRPTEATEAAGFRCDVMLVPLDGTPDAEVALPMAGMLAERTGAALRLVRVVPTVGTVSGEASPAATFSPTATAALLDIEQQAARDYLAEVRRRDLPAGLRVTLEVRRGDVATELAKSVAEEGSDLVVMSTHGRSGLAGILTGSVASRFLSRIAVPLLLIRIDGGSANDAPGGATG